MRRTKEEAEKTRKQIIKAAIKVMNKKGISSTRFEDIAEEANVTRGAIYHYFKNKNEIIYATHSDNKEKMHDLLDSFLRKETDPVCGMKKGLLGIFKNFEKDADFRAVEELFLKIEFASLLKEDKELAQKFEIEKEDMRCRIQEIMEKGQNAGLIRSDIEVKNLRIAVMSFYIGFVFLWFSSYTNFSIGDTADDYVNILLNGIVKK